MPVETVNYISDLNPAWPDGTEPKSQGDEHLRNTKRALRQNFPNFGGAVNATHTELNYMVGVTSAVQTQLNSKPNKAGDAYTGSHDFSTAGVVVLPANTSIGSVSSIELGYMDGVTGPVQTQFSARDSAISTKAAKAGDTYTGAHNFGGAVSVTLPANTSVGSVTSAEIARLGGVTGAVQVQIDSKVNRAGDAYTGTHNMTGATVTVPTQATADSTTKAASTQFVKAAISDAALSAALPGQAGNAGKFITTDGTSASWARVPWTSIDNVDAPTKAGVGASGTWGINISGSAASATDPNAMPKAGGEFTGQVRTANNSGPVTGAGAATFHVMGDASNAAMLTFHRYGAYAINFGLDTDNVIRMGGCSLGAGATLFSIGADGAFTARNNVTAYSDARLKYDIKTIGCALGMVRKMRGVFFKRSDETTGKRHVGVIAQEMREVLPEVILENRDAASSDEVTLSVAYGNICGVLIEAVKELAAEVAEMKRDRS